MKIFISADIEGSSGIASFSQCGAASSDYPDYLFARRMMTDDLNAVIRGARRAGATQVVVKDGHGNCKNLLIDELERGTELISGHGSEFDGMMDGIDGSFSGAMLVGYHAMAGASNALMEHALVGGLHRFWINGRPAGEILTNAAVAGAYGVPTLLVHSDRAGTAECWDCLPEAETFSTKDGIGKYMGKMSHPSDLTLSLESAAFRAMGKIGRIPCVTYSSEVVMTVSFRTQQETELAALAEGVS